MAVTHSLKNVRARKQEVAEKRTMNEERSVDNESADIGKSVHDALAKAWRIRGVGTR